jgi:hypothetical protein
LAAKKPEWWKAGAEIGTAVKWTSQMPVLNRQVPVTRDSITISAGPRLRTAMILAIIADLFQLVVFPLVIEGALSPADDMLDVSVAGILSWLLGWHWEFLPSFLAKLVPGVDMVPCWTIAVANVYRKNKQLATRLEGIPENKHA